MLDGPELEELELPNLDGHKASRPVRIGNRAATHIQLVGASSYCSRGFWSGYN
jgi:GH15 family glucan-1,4-alpha-glucosidase